MRYVVKPTKVPGMSLLESVETKMTPQPGQSPLTGSKTQTVPIVSVTMLTEAAEEIAVCVNEQWNARA